MRRNASTTWRRMCKDMYIRMHVCQHHACVCVTVKVCVCVTASATEAVSHACVQLCMPTDELYVCTCCAQANVSIVRMFAEEQVHHLVWRCRAVGKGERIVCETSLRK